MASLNSYYMMDCIKYRRGYLRRIETDPAFAKISGPWINGQRLKNVPRSLECVLDPLVKGEMPVFFKKATIPLMREDLLDTLRGLGVRNIDSYEATIRDPETGQTWNNYKAVNFVEVISAANMKKSKFEPTNPPLIDVLFDSVAVDASKTGGALLFRLAENLSALMAHKKIKTAIEAQPERFPYMVFIEPEEWAG